MARFGDIVLALVSKCSEVITDENAIIVTARRELPVLVGNHDLLIRIRSARDTEGTTNAAGRHAMWIRRYVDLIIRARQYADVSQQDLQWLTDETNGILDIEAQLLDLLQLWFPALGLAQPDPGELNPVLGNDPQFLLIEPARIVSCEDPLREVVAPRQANPGVSDPNCGMLALRMDIYYAQDLNQAIQ